MPKIKTKHNDLIIELINSNKFVINEDGTIFNLKGKQLGFVLKTELTLRNKQYKYIKYKRKSIKIHRIIWQKFRGNLAKNQVIHHINGNGLDNRLENLQQMPQQDNAYYTYHPSTFERETYVDTVPSDDTVAV